jgi:hypothetical protein
MTVNVKEHLTKIINDVVANRANLANQVEAQKQQLDVNQSQLEYFDTIIAGMKVQLADQTDETVQKILAVRSAPGLTDKVGVEVPPLAAAGAADAVAGAAANEGVPGTDANGSPV